MGIYSTIKDDVDMTITIDTIEEANARLSLLSISFYELSAKRDEIDPA